MRYTFFSILCLLLLHNSETRSQWVLTEHLSPGRITSLTVKDDFVFASTDMSGAFRTSDNGMNWTPVNSGLVNSSVSSFAVNSSGIFASTVSGVFMSTNNGDNWTNANNGLAGGVIRKIVSRNNYIYAGHILAGVFRSTNNGNNWTRFALGEGDKMFTLYCTQNEFYISIANTILLTTNEGATFNAVTNGLTNLWVMSLSSFEDDLYAGTRGGVFHSTNTGNLWTRSGSDLTDTVFNVLVNKGVNVFAGSEHEGVFLSTNKGQSWMAINSGLTDSNITALCTSAEFLFAGTENGNVWRRPLSEIPLTIPQTRDYVPEDFKLLGNFPNPFNPSTKILFSVNKNLQHNAQLTIYNSSGKLIEIKDIRINGAGIYETEWQATDQPSGVYFYFLKSGEATLSSKMILLK